MVQIHLEEMPRIRAREALQEASILGIGTGNIRQSDRAKALRLWEKAASEPGEKEKITPQEARVRLEMMGIKVVKK